MYLSSLIFLLCSLYIGVFSQELLPDANIPVCLSDPEPSDLEICYGKYFPDTPLYNDILNDVVSLVSIPITAIVTLDDKNDTQYDHDDFLRYVDTLNAAYRRAGMQFEPRYMRVKLPTHLTTQKFCKLEKFCAGGGNGQDIFDYIRDTVLGEDRPSYGVLVVVADAVAGHNAFGTLPYSSKYKSTFKRNLLMLFFPALWGGVSNTLMHETGHIFGLHHSFRCTGDCSHPWLSGDLVGDTVPIPNAALKYSWSRPCVYSKTTVYKHYDESNCWGNTQPTYWPGAQFSNIMSYSHHYCKAAPEERLTVGQLARARCFYEEIVKPLLPRVSPSLEVSVEVTFPYTWVIGGTFTAKVAAPDTVLEVYLVPGTDTAWRVTNLGHRVESWQAESGVREFDTIWSDNGAVLRGTHVVFVKVGDDEYRRGPVVTLMSALCEADESADNYHAFGVCVAKSVCESSTNRRLEASAHCAFADVGTPDFGCCFQDTRDVSLGSAALGVGDKSFAHADVPEATRLAFMVDGLLMAGERVHIHLITAYVEDETAPAQRIDSVWLVANTEPPLYQEAFTLPGDPKLPILIDEHVWQVDAYVYIPQEWVEKDFVIRVVGTIYENGVMESSVDSAVMRADAPPCMATDSFGRFVSGTCQTEEQTCSDDSYLVANSCGSQSTLMCCAVDASATEGAYRVSGGGDDGGAEEQSSNALLIIVGLSLGVVCICLIMGVLLVVLRSRDKPTRVPRARRRTSSHSLSLGVRRITPSRVGGVRKNSSRASIGVRRNVSGSRSAAQTSLRTSRTSFNKRHGASAAGSSSLRTSYQKASRTSFEKGSMQASASFV